MNMFEEGLLRLLKFPLNTNILISYYIPQIFNTPLLVKE